MTLVYLIGLMLLGGAIVLFTPQSAGILVLLVIVFAVTVLNARRTRELHAGMEEIRRHLGLMGDVEAKSYDMEREVDRADRLSEAEREDIDRRTEAELADEGGDKRE